MSDDVELEEVIAAGMEHRLLDVHKAQPARVESYNANANTVTVTPMLYRQIPTDDGDYVAEALPQIPDVKVQFPRAGGFAITFPIQKGDFVLLVFCDTSTAAWRQNGQPGDPGDPERHGMSGAVAIPGVFPDQQNISNPDTTNMVLGKIGTPAAQIEITPTEIHCGAGATDFAGNATKIKSYLVALATAINGWTPVANDGGAALKSALSTAGIIGGTWGSDCASTNTKVK